MLSDGDLRRLERVANATPPDRATPKITPTVRHILPELARYRSEGRTWSQIAAILCEAGLLCDANNEPVDAASLRSAVKRSHEQLTVGYDLSRGGAARQAT